MATKNNIDLVISTLREISDKQKVSDETAILLSKIVESTDGSGNLEIEITRINTKIIIPASVLTGVLNSKKTQTDSAVDTLMAKITIK